MIDAEAIGRSVREVRERIAVAARRAGRDAGEVRLVAVTKLHPPPAIAAACAAGQRLFGENYAQELSAKAAEVGGGAEWHFIGHLQRNKVRQVVGVAQVIETVDSLALAQEIGRRAAQAGLVQDVLLQVNVGGEEQKSGIEPDGLDALLDGVRALGSLRCRGLMTMPPWGMDAEEARPHFAALRQLREAAARRHPDLDLGELSMGMSGDFEVAIAEGATLVRIGTAIFGPRPA